MSAETLLEERIAKVEEAVSELQRIVTKKNVDPNWLQKMIGSMGGDPAFEEVVRLGREIRQADRPPEDEAP